MGPCVYVSVLLLLCFDGDFFFTFCLNARVFFPVNWDDHSFSASYPLVSVLGTMDTITQPLCNVAPIRNTQGLNLGSRSCKYFLWLENDQNYVTIY